MRKTAWFLTTKQGTIEAVLSTNVKLEDEKFLAFNKGKLSDLPVCFFSNPHNGLPSLALICAHFYNNMKNWIVHMNPMSNK